ncbi:MAG: prepilin-type N-terminal cleavage/methylation domain-containing protein [Deltaproteobacteria bacterium]|nr:prepilin-type N-terminal cleavage/methylation domain-containing protein [Deltaproteobacteria bacterium]
MSPVGKDSPELHTFHSRFCLLNETGFSLIELLAVLLLIGLSSIIVLPSIDRVLQERDVRRSARELAAVARSLRYRALSNGTVERLIFNPAENSYQVYPDKTAVLSAESKITGIDGGEPVGEGLRQFLFFPNGSVLAGEIGLSGREGSPVYFIRFDPLTGKVAVLQGNRQ